MTRRPNRIPRRRGAGLRKIADEQRPCSHPSHDPPKMIVLSPGLYEHTCPACGVAQIFRVRGVWL